MQKCLEANCTDAFSCNLILRCYSRYYASINRKIISRKCKKIVDFAIITQHGALHLPSVVHLFTRLIHVGFSPKTIQQDPMSWPLSNKIVPISACAYRQFCEDETLVKRHH